MLAGLLRYGPHDEARRLADGFFSAVAAFPDAEPPELFCGYAADRFGTAMRDPSACRPPAWASAAVLLAVRSLLGLDVDPLERRISLAPTILSDMSRLEVLHIPVGGDHVDVSARVQGGGATADVRGLPAGWRRVEPEAAT